jgi:hypothetical protein
MSDDVKNTLPQYPDDKVPDHDTRMVDDFSDSATDPTPGDNYPDRGGWGKPDAAQAETAVGTVDEEDEYEYVRTPQGIRAIRKDQIVDAPVTSKQDASATARAAEVPEAQFYVHLANGDVERVAESDLPTGAGTNHPNGQWTKDGNAFQVIGVYPVEDTVEKAK